VRDELMEDFNKILTEYNDDKHEIKARFKHMMKLLEDPNGDESTYREDEEVDLEKGFDEIE
jgi:hypothetical protein